MPYSPTAVSERARDPSALRGSGGRLTSKLALSLVIPCYNEEAVLPETLRRLVTLMRGLQEQGKLSPSSRIYCVDDGSTDRTWRVIESLSCENVCVHGIKLAHNRGHQNALLAGLLTAEGDAIISVDADLQDDLSAIEKMIDAHAAGSDVVYGVRRRRDTDGYFKRLTAEGYYRLLSLMGVEVVFNHADYRLLSRRAIEALRDYGEANLFLRGIISQLGYPSAIVHYDRAARFAGESKYPLRKMLSLAWNGITSFSAVPLRAITVLGFVVSGLSFAVALWALWARLVEDTALPGWASTVLPVYFLGGIQLLCIGIIGEYLAKIYMETKRRPRFTIEKIL